MIQTDTPPFFSAAVRPRFLAIASAFMFAAAILIGLASGSKPVLASIIPGLAVVALTVGIYFLSAILAHRRRHHNAAAILVLNLLLGW